MWKRGEVKGGKGGRESGKVLGGKRFKGEGKGGKRGKG